MRIATFLLSSALLLAACADNGETTAPVSRVAASTAGVSSAQATPPGPSAKPVDQVGWTQAQTFFSNLVSLSSGQSGPAIVQCPAGTTPTGGGFEFVNTSGSLVIPPLVEYVGPVAAVNGWGVWVRNLANSGAVVTIKANVRCAS